MKTAVTAWRGYLVAVHLALAALVVHDAIPQRLAVKAGLTQPPPDLSAEARHESLIESVHVPRDQQAKPGAVVFLGDSITEMLLASNVAPNAVNHGISGQPSWELLASMNRYRSLPAASAVVVTTGTNDLRLGRAADIAGRYRSVLAAIPAGVPVVLSSVPPQAGRDVRPLVDAARSACASDPRCTFVDAFAALNGQAGVLREDGVHLTAKGYAIWAPLLRAALARPRLQQPDGASPLASGVLHPAGGEVGQFAR